MPALAVAPPSTQNQTGTALIVDAADELRLCARADMLTRAGAGVTVRVAGGAAAALEQVHRGGIDVVVANVALPDLDGAALLRALRSYDPDLPIVFVTEWPLEGTSGRELHNMVVAAMFGYRLARRHGRARQGGR
jgi:CheY-like chemotaxis protein